LENENSWFQRFRCVVLEVLAAILNQKCRDAGHNKSRLKPEYHHNYVWAAHNDFRPDNMPPQFPIRSLTVSEWIEIYRTSNRNAQEPVLFTNDDDNMSDTNSTKDADPTLENPVWEAQIPEASLAEAKEEEQIVMQDLEDDVLRQLKEKDVAPVCSSLFGLTCRRFWIISLKPDF
jgi:hypothetical protein